LAFVRHSLNGGHEVHSHTLDQTLDAFRIQAAFIAAFIELHFSVEIGEPHRLRDDLLRIERLVASALDRGQALAFALHRQARSGRDGPGPRFVLHPACATEVTRLRRRRHCTVTDGQ